MPFISNTDEQRRDMLAEIGLTTEDLFADVPQELRCSGLNLPEGLGEQEVPTPPNSPPSTRQSPSETS